MVLSLQPATTYFISEEIVMDEISQLIFIIVYFSTPLSKSHTLIYLSSLYVIISFELEYKKILVTDLVCPVNTLTSYPVSNSQIFIVLSTLAEIKYF
jgi:hypothetical protein